MNETLDPSGPHFTVSGARPVRLPSANIASMVSCFFGEVSAAVDCAISRDAIANVTRPTSPKNRFTRWLPRIEVPKKSAGLKSVHRRDKGSIGTAVELAYHIDIFEYGRRSHTFQKAFISSGVPSETRM